MHAILVVNAGSSSVKFQIFSLVHDGDPQRFIKGQIDGIGVRPRLRAVTHDGSALVDRQYATREIADVPAAIVAAGSWLRESQTVELVAVGHRVAHGGSDYDRPVVVDQTVLARLKAVQRACSAASTEQPCADRGSFRGPPAAGSGRVFRYRVPPHSRWRV